MLTRHSDGLRKISTSDYAYTNIKESIITGELKPDEPIVEKQLAQVLEISRTPLREALHRLELEELVVRQMNGRLKVASISVQEVKEIFTVRGKLEGLVVANATENAMAKDIDHLKTIVEMIKKSFEEGKIEEILYYGSEFHLSIYELSKNKTAVNILYQLNDHIYRYRRMIPNHDINRFEKSIAEHEQIIKSMSENDIESAQTAMEQHIEASMKIAISSIQEKINES
ncbi:MAG TPA: GntR family transcriptional regulator [Candidatus Dormibacteraeota bacterium]|nr:GntR family transcriptional regulator [Candidatus Dormibacteraeota bacterium]